MRLIDADALKEQLKTDTKSTTFTLIACGLLDAAIAVDRQPTIEAVPLKPMAKVMADACDNRIDAEMWEELLRRTDWECSLMMIVQKWNQREPGADVIRCRDCKFFEVRDWWGEMKGVPLLAASDVPTCTRWGGGCMTKEDGYCFLAERKEPDNDQP